MLQRDRGRSALIMALLVATFVLTAFMAVRAQRAATYHRATAEKVILDWTLVAADELARRTDAQAGFYGTYPLLQTMLAMDGVPTRAALAAQAKNAEARRNTRLVRCAFRFDTQEKSVSAPECPEAVRTWLRPALQAIVAARTPPDERVPLHAAIGNTMHTFVYAFARDEKSISGFEVDHARLAPFFASVVETRPLMPQSLANGRITNDVIHLRALDPGRRQIFASGSEIDGALRVRRSVDEGLLHGWSVEASIAPDVAQLLVFGGVPRPLPIYMVTLAVTGLLLLTALLQLKKERALARLRSEFVASVSHELRTPLTQIRMFAETLLLERVRSEEERRRALTVIDQETRRLAQLVENVLQFSRGQRGTLVLTRRPVDIADLVRRTIESFRPIAAARNVTLRATLAPSVTVEGDPDAISQIVLNLLDNAVKYGPAGQEVEVIVEASAGTARIVVSDSGPGVPSRDRKRIWRRYERLERDSSRAVAGAGIGLAVVQDLVTLHRGKASVEEAPGGGARFVVELPS